MKPEIEATKTLKGFIELVTIAAKQTIPNKRELIDPPRLRYMKTRRNYYNRVNNITKFRL